jgi:hypothetical protein
MARSAARHAKSPAFLNSVVAHLIWSEGGEPDPCVSGHLESLTRSSARLTVEDRAPKERTIIRLALGMPPIEFIGAWVAPVEDHGTGRFLVLLNFHDPLNPSKFKTLVDRLSPPG